MEDKNKRKNRGGVRAKRVETAMLEPYASTQRAYLDTMNRLLDAGHKPQTVPADAAADA
jgi:hypothetical protein